jgi:PhzF family phenazine biosynthesis protein
MAIHPFTQLDVFSSEPLSGNPLAVVHDADALDTATMQRIAQWTNLSETTFLLRPRAPDADYALRIFTPAHEMRFAGHPTLGSARAFLARGGSARQEGQLVQECAVGLVRIRLAQDRLAFAAPPMRTDAVGAPLLAAVLTALALPAHAVREAALLDNGRAWLALELADAAQLHALVPDHKALARLCSVGLIAPSAAGTEARYDVRAFAAHAGIDEDPVTGGLNAALAQWLATQAAPPPASYVVAQGHALGRAGRVFVEREAEHVWIGGYASPVVQGQLTL